MFSLPGKGFLCRGYSEKAGVGKTDIRYDKGVSEIPTSFFMLCGEWSNGMICKVRPSRMEIAKG